MSYSLNSLQGGGVIMEDYIGFLLQGLLRGIPGVWTMPHMSTAGNDGNAWNLELL